MSTPRPVGLVVLLCALCGAPAPLRAQPAGDPALHVERGAALFQHGDFRAALTEFEAAYQLTRSWQVLVHIGITQSRLLRYKEALATLERYLEEGGAAVPPELRARAESEIKAIRALLVRVTVVVDGGPAELTVDGEGVGTSPLSKPLLLSPGAHAFRAVREGHQPAEKRVTLTSGAAVRVVLAPVRKKGILRVESAPAGARVIVEGREVGRTPWEGRLPAQGHTVTLRLEGFRPGEERVILEAGVARELRLSLEALPPPPPRPWYKKWYWWTAVGAVVAGGAVTAALVATRKTYDYDATLFVPAGAK